MVLAFPLYCSSLSSLPAMVLPFPLYYLSLSSSLPWFLLSLCIVQAFLLWSAALAVQALPLAHDMEWFLKGSTISPSLSSASQVFKWSQNVCWVSGVRSHEGNKHLHWRPSLTTTVLGSSHAIFWNWLSSIFIMPWNDLELVRNQSDIAMELS